MAALLLLPPSTEHGKESNPCWSSAADECGAMDGMQRGDEAALQLGVL